MADTLDNRVSLDVNEIGDAREAISTLAWTHGIKADPEPIDAFVNAASRLCDTEVRFDRFERLLLGLARGGFVTDEQRFALHAAYLQQRASDVRSVR